MVMVMNIQSADTLEDVKQALQISELVPTEKGSLSEIALSPSSQIFCEYSFGCLYI